MKTVIISDLHLGASISFAKKINKLLYQIENNKLFTDKLILAGDVFDSFNFNRLSTPHWEVFSKIRKISKNTEVIWLHGNHDGPAEIIAHLVGVEVLSEYIYEDHGKRIMVIHGDQFDDFVTNHPIITEIVTGIYYLIQKIDKDFYWSTLLKQKSKSFLRCAEQVKLRAKEYSKKHNCDIICCGHTHKPEEDVFLNYYNSGSWTEPDNYYIYIINGKTNLIKFD